MSNEVTSLQTIYQFLHRFYQQSAQATDSDKLPLIAEQLAKRIELLFQQQPRLLWSQWSLVPKDSSLLSRLAMQHATSLLTIASQSGWPQEVQQELLAAALFSLCGLARLLPQPPHAALHNPWLITLKTQQELLRQHRWLNLLLSCVRYRQQQPSWQQVPYASVLCLSYQLCQPGLESADGTLSPFEQQYRRLWLTTATPGRLLLDKLATAGAAVFQSGRFCRDESGSTYLLTDCQQQPSGYLLDEFPLVPVGECEQLTGTGWQLLPPQQCTDWRWYRLLVRRESLPTPDANKTELPLQQIRQLDATWSISRQLKFLAQHPQLSEALLQIVSKLNRQQRQITDLRYALAMLGTTQLPERLTQSWLLQQISSCAHPWQLWFAHFADVLSCCLQLFAQQSPHLQLTPVQADLLAQCLVLSLQKQTILRYLPLQPAARQTDCLEIQCRRQIWQNPQLLAEVASLVSACGLPLQWHDAFLQLCITGPGHTIPEHQQPGSLLLQLALMFTELIYMSNLSRPQSLAPTLQSANQALALPQQSVSSWTEQILAATSACWPLFPFIATTECS